ncbi:WD-REPEATS-REGION domain-containing protein [Mycena sanguinolenta]|uniref:WD-REPEATS-REGION domain-containing protein n=1 Tax=Mycena sanguinolenta TaxID=230812 RepID=A0A8H6X5A5_9AGAR|nr:WD-REPEATS-REGION domain-containing protein [Mycena sanguinolenta]
MTALDNILPVLRVAQATAAGNPVPGLEGAISGVVALAEMVSSWTKRLKQVADIDPVGWSDNLKQRLDILKDNLKPINARLISLEKKSEIKQFFKGKKYEKEIQGIKASIMSHIQDFTFHNTISIKNLLIRWIHLSQEWNHKETNMTQGKGMEDWARLASPLVETPNPSELITMEIKKGYGRGDRGQDRTRESLTVNNYIYGGTGGPGGRGFGQGTGGDGGSGKGPSLNYTINTIENFMVNSDHVEQTLAKIKYISARYNASNTPEKCMEGTRIDIIQDIIAHLTAPYTSQRIVMLSGSAGTGKSTIAKTVASILAEETHILAASFFFSQNYAERREIKGLPLTLAYQLADYNADFQNILIKFLDEDHTGILDSDPKLQFQKLVVDLLAQISTIAFSTDGKQIVSGSNDSTVRLWDAENGAPVGKPLKGHTDLVTSVVFSPDGKHIVSGSHDMTVRLWDAEHEAPLRMPLEGHTNWVASVAFSPDGRQIVSGSGDRTVRLWDAKSGAPVGKPLEGHTESVASVAFSPDGKHIVSGSNDGTVCLWDAESGAQLGKPLKGYTDWVISVAFSSDGKQIVSSFCDKTVCLWNAECGAPLGKPLEGHTSWDRTICLWDAANGTPVGKPLEGHTDWVTSVAFSPNGKHIVSGSSDRTVRIWDAGNGAPVGQTLEGHTNWVGSVAFSPDGKHIVSGSNDGTVCLWDAESGEQLGKPLKGHTDWVISVAFSSDGKIVSGSDDKTVRLWDAENGTPVGKPLESHTDSVTDGQYIVSGSEDRTVRLWDAGSGAPVGKPLEGHAESVTSVAFSPDGKHVVSGSADNTVCLWNAENGAPVGKPLKGHTHLVTSVAFSFDGKHIVSGSNDKTVCLWNAENRTLVGKPLEGHTDWVISVAFSPDGKHIVSGSEDRTVRLWDAGSGAPVGKPLEGHTDSVASVAFSPDGKHIVSGSHDRTVRLWDAQSVLSKPLEGHTELATSSLDGKNINICSQDALQVAHPNMSPFQSDLPIFCYRNSIEVSFYSLHKFPLFTLLYFSSKALIFLLSGLFRKVGFYLAMVNFSSGSPMNTELDSGCLSTNS